MVSLQDNKPKQQTQSYKFSVLLNSWPMKKAYKESTNLVKSKQINKHQ